MATKFTPEELASGRLLDFTRLARPDLSPNWHHRLLADRLQRVESGEIKRLIVQMPPGHGKSTLSTQLFPAWYLGRHPERDLVVVSHGKALASDFGREVRNVIRQLATPDHLRGRMISVNMIFFLGGPQLGELEAGLVAHAVGARASVVIGGVCSLISTAFLARSSPELLRFRRE